MGDIHESASAAAAAVFANTGRDLSHYKRSTFERAIYRRASHHGLPSADEYVRRLIDDPDECELLLNELLIGVTRFFRDDHGFSSLCASIAALPAGEKIRCWSAGCATGEEAYSLVMLLAECFDGKGATPDVRVFATDLDDRALAIARSGTYSSTAPGLDSSRLARFFVHDGSTAQVRRELRDRVLFAKHDLAADPPFRNLDVVSCRNVLMYFGRSIQAQILEVLHYALRPGGLLFVGAAETADEELFSPIDAEWRVYRRRDSSRPARSTSPVPPLPPCRSHTRRSVRPRPAATLDPHHEQLQAMCEELRTTTEDLRQVNAELRAVNGTLRERVAEVSRARDDLRNLVEVAGIAAVIVDADLRIQRYTEPLRKIVPLTPADIGRPLTAFASWFPSPSPIAKAPRVLETLETHASVAVTARGARCLTRIAPYRTAQNVIDGILITIVDVTSTPNPSRRWSRRRRRPGRVLHLGGLSK